MAGATVGRDIVGVSAAKLVPWALAPLTSVLIGRYCWMGPSRRGVNWQILCNGREGGVRELISHSSPEASMPFADGGEDAWVEGKSIGN